LDLAYLWADPLMERCETGGLKQVENPLDFEHEFKSIYDILRRTEKKIVIRKEAGNLQSLSEILGKKPKMLHISCHGDFDQQLKQYYLALEEKDNGILDKFNAARLEKLLDEEEKVDLVFVSACHS